ncbi:MAG: ATP-binding cassette domain-containing protein, partial [Alphaproteobacteria bacterium]
MIELKDIDVTFNAGTPLETRALRGVDLTVPAGEFLTVIGSNGAGKSTALNVLAGQVPVAAGTVRLDDQEVTDWPIHRRAPLISRVFQDPKLGTCEDLTIIENFALANGRTQPKGFRFAIGRGMRGKVADRLRVLGLGLEDRLDDKVGLLSGGQRQA